MPARLSSPDLVGRDDALAAVTGAIGAATAGPRFVIVRGEAGIGKTRLVREAIAQLPDDTLVLLGDCLDIGTGGLPYLPIVEALRRLARTADPATLAAALGKGRAELVALVPELGGTGTPALPGTAAAAEPLPEAAMAQLTTGLAQARLFERILGMLGALAERAPVLLVIEDVHWIDRATRDLLTFLARNLTEERIAILLTFREHDLPRGHPDPRLAGRDRAVAVDGHGGARSPRCAGRRPPAPAHRGPRCGGGRRRPRRSPLRRQPAVRRGAVCVRGR